MHDWLGSKKWEMRRKSHEYFMWGNLRDGVLVCVGLDGWRKFFCMKFLSHFGWWSEGLWERSRWPCWIFSVVHGGLNDFYPWFRLATKNESISFLGQSQPLNFTTFLIQIHQKFFFFRHIKSNNSRQKNYSTTATSKRTHTPASQHQPTSEPHDACNELNGHDNGLLSLSLASEMRHLMDLNNKWYLKWSHSSGDSRVWVVSRALFVG
jgi:hypothetical protein